MTEIDDKHPNDCNARLFFSDDYGDNRCTMRCQLGPDHAGLHQETFAQGGESQNLGPVIVTWVADQRFNCRHHGLQESDDCRTCFDAYVTCSVHGVRDYSSCTACWDDTFTCPEHGVQTDGYCHVQTETGWCHSSIQDRWTKNYDRGPIEE